MDNKRKNRLIHIMTPFIAVLVCGAIGTAAMIKPYDKIKMYMNLAFMDEFKTSPDEKHSGLEIKDNDIISDYKGDTSDNGEIIRPVFGELYAVLECNAIETDVPVYWGCTSELFERGACQSTGSVVAGDNGNSVISAHVDTYFASLEKLKKGDKVTLKTNYGKFVYEVRENIVFNKKDGRYVSPSKDDILTLYTCKKGILGNMDERIGVICDLTEKKFYSETGEVSADE